MKQVFPAPAAKIDNDLALAQVARWIAAAVVALDQTFLWNHPEQILCRKRLVSNQYSWRVLLLRPRTLPDDAFFTLGLDHVDAKFTQACLFLQQPAISARRARFSSTQIVTITVATKPTPRTVRGWPEPCFIASPPAAWATAALLCGADVNVKKSSRGSYLSNSPESRSQNFTAVSP